MVSTDLIGGVDCGELTEAKVKLFNSYIKGRAKIKIISSLSVLALAGCSGGSSSSSSGGSVSSSVANISGSVSSSISSSSVFAKPHGLDAAKDSFGVSTESKDVSAYSESGCSIEARDIETNTVVATTTSDSSGNYTLTGVASGSTYRVNATCGANKYAVVATAVTSNPAEVAASDRVATNPRSTVIAAYIVETVLKSVTEATASLSPTAAALVKSAIMKALDSVIQTITATVQEAISSGAMAEPTVTDSTNVATSLREATSAAAATTAVSVAPTAPVSVTQAVAGARSSSVALQACSSALGGTEASCIRAVGKLMNNVLGFPVGVRLTGGAFNPASCAASAALNSGSELMSDYFPNAEFKSHSDSAEIPAGYCAVIPKVSAPDRNRGYESSGGGDGGGPVFVETGDLDGTAGNETGGLTELGKALFAGKKYNLASVDKFIFGSTGGAGFNARLLNRRFVAGAGTGSANFYYLGSDGNWASAVLASTCDTNGHEAGSTHPCDWQQLNFGFTGYAWNTAVTQTAFAAQLGAGDVVAKGVMFHQFGGEIPSQNELDGYINQGRVHSDYNITGEKEIHVVTNKTPKNIAGANPCWDNDPTTPCLGEDGLVISGLRVNMTLGTADATTKIRPITALAAAADGEYYLRPYYGSTGFSGVLGFIKAADGRIARDEQMNDRAVKIVFSSADCGANSLPSTGSGCGAGVFYNVSLDWSSCNGGGGGGGGSTCPGYAATSSTAITASSLSLTVKSNYQSNFEMFCGEGVSMGSCQGHQLVSVNNSGQMSPYKFSYSSGAYHLSGSSGKALVSGEFNLAVFYQGCDATGCSVGGFYFVDYQGVKQTVGGAPTAVYGTSGVAVYTSAEVSSGNDFSPSGGTQTLDSVAISYSIPEGPIRNPNFSCDAEPFFIDGNGNGQLDCTVVSGFSQASGGDISFSSVWEYQNFLNSPNLRPSEKTARQAMVLHPRDNAFEYGDPVGTKRLMATAFNGWFDGKHTLTAATELDALQSFSLLYMFMSSGGDSKHIKGLVPNEYEFKVLAPMFGNGMDIKVFNESIGLSFDTYKL
jgi:hypothetical protein